MSEDYINYNYKMPTAKSKQSSVEWLATQIMDNWNDITAGARNIAEFIEQAKAMHKEEIVKSHMNVSDDRDYRLQDVILKEFAEEYYEKNYAE